MVIGREGVAAARLAAPTIDEFGSAFVPIRLSAGGLTASGRIELEEWSGGIGRLAAYFSDLALHWQGWTGTKDLRDDGPEVSLSAAHDGVGRVTLTVSISNPLYAEAWTSWSVVLAIAIEPGELGRISTQINQWVDPA